jgi:hypothetical protein
MGANSSAEKMESFSNLRTFKHKSCKKLTTKHIQVIRRSWKEITEVADFKTHGLNMMIRFVNKNFVRFC